MKIALASIPINSPIEAYKFYTEVLGFKEKLYKPEAYLAMWSLGRTGWYGCFAEPNNNPIIKRTRKQS
jgi:hypothetical protein